MVSGMHEEEHMGSIVYNIHNIMVSDLCCMGGGVSLSVYKEVCQNMQLAMTLHNNITDSDINHKCTHNNMKLPLLY